MCTQKVEILYYCYNRVFLFHLWQHFFCICQVLKIKFSLCLILHSDQIRCFYQICAAEKNVFTAIVSSLWSRSADELVDLLLVDWSLIIWVLWAERGCFLSRDMSRYSKWTSRICCNYEGMQSFGLRIQQRRSSIMAPLIALHGNIL